MWNGRDRNEIEKFKALFLSASNNHFPNAFFNVSTTCNQY